MSISPSQKLQRETFGLRIFVPQQQPVAHSIFSSVLHLTSRVWVPHGSLSLRPATSQDAMGSGQKVQQRQGYYQKSSSHDLLVTTSRAQSIQGQGYVIVWSLHFAFAFRKCWRVMIIWNDVISIVNNKGRTGCIFFSSDLQSAPPAPKVFCFTNSILYNVDAFGKESSNEADFPTRCVQCP